MGSTSQLSTWSAIATSVGTSIVRPTYPALDLFAAVVSTPHIWIYSLNDIGIKKVDLSHSMDERQVGMGGFAVVELGITEENHMVAVKRMRLSRKDVQADFENILRQFSLELRILCHNPLKDHPNIINLIGYRLEEVDGLEVPFLALGLEYSSEGTLKAFLRNNQHSLSVTTLMDLVFQVAKGLEALHRCNICHGDVKIQNALVFRNENVWTVKLSDFGGSIVGSSDDLSLPVRRCFGTRLMNAPEIRTDTATNAAHFTIDDAFRTDVFSFGLLVWEVLKQGSNYYDEQWCAGLEGSVDVDNMEEYLEKLPHNGLLSKACEYVRSEFCGYEVLGLMSWTLNSSLQDDSTKRRSIKEIREHLESQNPPVSTHNMSQSDTMKHEPLCAWSTRESLFLTRDGGVSGVDGAGRWLIPAELQKRIALDLKSLSESEAFSIPDRAHAAICVAESYSLGFGVTHDKKLVAQWIYRASELGSLKAAAWYPRVCSANDIAPIRSSHLQEVFDFEGNLDDLTSDAYLSNRIQLQNSIAIKHIKTTVLAQHRLLSFDPSKYISQFGLFNDRMLDDLSPLHVASLLGDDVSVSNLLSHQKEGLSSSQKLTSIHYACIGGHLSTLQLLLRHSSVSNAANPRGITPLHLCVFFVGDDARKAASLLLKHGNNPNAKILEPISWDYHDIYLVGTALDWATRTRHRSLVHSLLPFAQDDSCLRIAVENFFWDIAEVILQDSPGIANVPVSYAQEVSELNDELQINHTENAGSMQTDLEAMRTPQQLSSDDDADQNTRESPELSFDEYYYLTTLVSPFTHWIAHGQDHLIAMQRTLQTSLDADIIASEHAQYMALTTIILTAHNEDDFALIAFCAAKFPSESVKRTTEGDDSALAMALRRSSIDWPVWLKPLEAIINLYTIEELEEGPNATDRIDRSYLHHAIRCDSVIGTRLLLEKGMDANQRMYNPITSVLMDIPLLLTRTRYKKTNELDSLLIEHGARDDITGDISPKSYLEISPDKEVLRRALQNDTVPHNANALHDILASMFAGLPSEDAISREHEKDKQFDAILYKYEQIDAVQKSDRMSTINLCDYDLEGFWSKLESMNTNKTRKLELALGQEQLGTLLGYMSLDSKQRPTSLDLTFQVGQSEYLDGLERGLAIRDDTFSAWKSEGLENDRGLYTDPEHVMDPDNVNPYWKEYLKLLLGFDHWSGRINDTDQRGMTLIQKAASVLSLDGVTILLEAGADASIPLSVAGHDPILPLQIACSMGRACQWGGVRRRKPMSLGKRSMEVALELLQWHHTRADGLFEGITKLHLASRMCMGCKVGSEHSKTAKGHWPGIHRPVGWKDLIVRIADDESMHNIAQIFRMQDPVSSPKQLEAIIRSVRPEDYIVEHYRQGYPRLAAFLTLDPDFTVFKRFDNLHVRVLLEQQDRLCELQQQLEDCDDTETIQMNLSSRRQDGNRARREILAQIKTELKDYGTRAKH
ncbi:MAG: hypothetical protein Q9178_005146 [Gyalolechia marmorata]